MVFYSENSRKKMPSLIHLEQMNVACICRSSFMITLTLFRMSECSLTKLEFSFVFTRNSK